MTRKLFWTLLGVNVLLFAAMQWGGLLTTEPDALVPTALHEEKIRLLEAPSSAEAQAAPVSAAVSSVPVAATVPTSEARACMEWGEFSGADLTRAAGALGALRLGNRLDRREVEYSIGYWVYIPPLKDKATVTQKIEQLKERGIEEYFVVQDAGAWFNAISLGVFKTREAAQNFVNQLRTKDVRSAQIGERSSKLKATVFVLNGLDAALAEKLTGLQKDFPDSVLKQISCTR